jgi:primosomal replication protein N
MKNLGLILLLFVSFSQSSWAQLGQSDIQFRLRNDKLLTVVMDGRHYKRYGRSVSFLDVPSGMHEVKVYRFYPNDNNRYDGNYRARAVLVYKGRMRVDAYTTYFCTIDPQYKTMSIRESKEALYEREKTQIIEEKPDFEEGREDNWKDRDADQFEERNRPTASIDNNMLTNEQLYTLKAAVEERMSSGDKVNLIQNFLETKKLQTEQVKTILTWLSFDNSKLQVAKFCYPRTTDQDNYLQVSGLLSFQNSKNELEKLMFTASEKTNKNNNPNNQTLNNVHFNQLARAVKDKITDTDKLKLMQQSLSDHTMQTTQIGEMLDWLTFEGSKLEFVQWAYSRTIDRNNYGQLKNKFSFLSSKKAVDDLMKK